MARTGEVITVLLISALTAFFVRTLIHGGRFRHILNHAPGPCTVLEVSGAEDVEVLPSGLAFVSSGLRYVLANKLDPVVRERKGKLLTMYVPGQEKKFQEIPLKSFDASDFNPHGLSLFTDPATGDISVFVINHKSNGSQVIEIFDFEPKSHSLVHRRSVVDPRINSPNDVLAVGRDSFYVTNDHYFHYDRALLRALEILLLNSWLRPDVIYFDGERGHVAAAGLKAPNGINKNKDGRYIFVSSGLDRGVNVYERQADNSLRLVQEIFLNTVVDNINVDPETGDLWLAGVPKVLDMVEHAANISFPAPAQVIAIRLNQLQSSAAVPFPDYEAREVYMNDGSELKAATSAIIFRDTLLVGAVFDKFLVCEVKAY